MTHLRNRMAFAALVVTLLPAVPLSILVRSLLERSFGSPLVAEVEDALGAGLDESRDRLREEKDAFARSAAGKRPGDREGFVLPDGRVRGDLPDGVAEWARSAALRPGSDAASGPERLGDFLVIRVPAEGGTRVLARPLPSGMAERAARITDTLSLLRALRGDRGAVLRSYVLPFAWTYAVLLALAALLGRVMAARIARPVEALAAAAHRVGGGDLGTRVDVTAPGEVGELVRAFNRMVEELATQRSELARLERLAAWRDLARSLAHEIKNPLTPIQLAVQQLGDRAPAGGDPEYAALLHECVEIVNEEVASLRRLVREFSEFARLPSPQPADGDLAALLDDLGRLYGDCVAVAVPCRPLPSRFDEAELRRALINLIDNGLAACREAGRTERVMLAATATGDAVIRVTDEGCGVEPGDRDRIFEPNFSTKSDGMGLGLAIVEGIVRGHGGQIDLESEPGRGTTFVVRLPAAGAGAPGGGS